MFFYILRKERNYCRICYSAASATDVQVSGIYVTFLTSHLYVYQYIVIRRTRLIKRITIPMYFILTGKAGIAAQNTGNVMGCCGYGSKGKLIISMTRLKHLK